MNYKDKCVTKYERTIIGPHMRCQVTFFLSESEVPCIFMDSRKVYEVVSSNWHSLYQKINEWKHSRNKQL